MPTRPAIRRPGTTAAIPGGAARIDPSEEQAMSEMWEGAMGQVLAPVEERIEAA
jgi:hypothetical protein